MEDGLNLAAEGGAGAMALGAATPAPSFFDTLLEHRIPQIAGLYLASAWTFFQFVQWLVDRYVLSPHLEEACLMLILLLLPAAVIIGYRPTSEGRRWARVQRVGVPCNLLGAVIVLFLLFGGKDMGSAQETVTVVDVDGNEEERVIPKRDFRKRVALFFFDNASGEADLDWLRHALPEAILADLQQDLFVTLKYPYTFAESLREAGFGSGFAVPFSLQRDLADEYRCAYIMNATFKKNGDNLILETKLYRAKTGREVETRTFEEANVFALVDAISLQLRHDLEIPTTYIENTVDLPVTELLTSSVEAFRIYAEGEYGRVFEQDLAKAERLFDEAVALDPTFAFVHMQRGYLYMNQQRSEEALAAHRAVQQYSYRVPERYRFATNATLFFFDKKPEEALQTVRQWTQLYPDDYLAFEYLANIHNMKGQTEEAVAARRRILEIDPDAHEQHLSIGHLLRNDGRYAEAREAFARYVALAPNDADGYRQLGHVYGRLGNLGRQREFYRQALVLKPNDPDILRSLGEVQLKQGAFEEALALYQQALDASRTGWERFNALRSLGWYYNLRGQYDAFVAHLEESWEVQATIQSPLNVLQDKADMAAAFARAGRASQSRAALAELRRQPAAATGILPLNIDIWEAFLLIETGQPEAAMALLDKVEQDIAAYGLEVQDWMHRARGWAFEELERWDESVAAYEAALAGDPASVRVLTSLGQVHFERKDYERAAEHFEEALRFYPAYPEAHLGLAKTRLAQKRPAAARPHLAKARDAWADAAPAHAEAAEVRELLASLGAAS